MACDSLYRATAIRAFMKWGVECRRNILKSLRLPGRRRADQSGSVDLVQRDDGGSVVRSWTPGGRPRRRNSHYAVPGATPTKPGSATLPFFGSCRKSSMTREMLCRAIQWKIGFAQTTAGNVAGLWAIRNVYKEVYWSEVKGSISPVTAATGQRRLFWIVGRIDDVLNVAGHRIGTAEVESALVSHQKVAEQRRRPPDDLKGQALWRL